MTIRGRVKNGVLDPGIDHYLRRPDKSWSVTDCISFVVMKQKRLRKALTAIAILNRPDSQRC